MARQGFEFLWPGKAGHGRASSGVAGHGFSFLMVWLGAECWGPVWFGKARTWCGLVWQLLMETKNEINEDKNCGACTIADAQPDSGKSARPQDGVSQKANEQAQEN